MCYCHTCRRHIHHLGIARHRAAHRDRQEDCVITFSTGVTKEWHYSVHNQERDNDSLTKQGIADEEETTQGLS